MAEVKRIAETAMDYQTMATDLHEPVILQHDGRDVAVILSVEEYRRLRALEVVAEERRRVAWEHMDALLEDIHSRPTDLSPDEIEAEITRARQEAWELRRAHHSSD